MSEARRSGRGSPEKRRARRRIGEVARESGLTIRALRHYDALGLVTPGHRSEAGYREYSDADIERLYVVLALKGLGLRLDEVRAALEGGIDLAATVQRHLERLEREIDAARELHARLRRLRGAIEALGSAPVEQVMEVMKAMAMWERYYTREQLDQIEARAAALGPEGLRRAEEAWATLIAEVRAEQARGTDPADPRMQELAGRWRALVEQFTGGDAGIERGLRDFYRQEGTEAASRGMLDPDLMSYVQRALEARSS